MKNIRKRDSERLDRETVKRVKDLLEGENSITKKKACEILNIAYNTARLSKIIEDFSEREEYRSKRRKELRNKPIAASEKSYIISSYLEGTSLSDISEATFRSITNIKDVLKEYAIPERETQINYESIILPEDSMQEDYESGDLVFSAKYNSPAKISKKVKNGVYRIWVYGEHMQYAYQPWYELGSLVKVQKELNIDIEDMSSIEINTLIAESIINARKKMKERKNG